mmetsp:Transcript_13937/g.35273  ORF Transcript_13937/g.35273 Transcript_13937/m.35273 type:complete len:200 (+) Transcript_13937:50-649(+)
MLIGFWRSCLNSWSQAAPTAPSTTRWSHERVTVTAVITESDGLPSSPMGPGTALRAMAPIPRLHACGSRTIGVKVRRPKAPRLLMVKVPTPKSRSLSSETKPRLSSEMAARPLRLAARITGMSTAFSSSLMMATLMSAFLYLRMKVWPHEALTSGTRVMHRAAARTKKSLTETRLASGREALSWSRSESRAVRSISELR